MRATRIMADLRVADIDEAKSFYADYLGLSTEQFNIDGGSLHLSRLQGERPARNARRNRPRRPGHFRRHG